MGCQAEGPEGINIGSSDIGSGYQDLGDPEATELGAGHAGGDGSPDDDGLYHVAHGHCPAASTVGTVGNRDARIGNAAARRVTYMRLRRSVAAPGSPSALKLRLPMANCSAPIWKWKAPV